MYIFYFFIGTSNFTRIYGFAQKTFYLSIQSQKEQNQLLDMFFKAGQHRTCYIYCPCQDNVLQKWGEDDGSKFDNEHRPLIT